MRDAEDDDRRVLARVAVQCPIRLRIVSEADVARLAQEIERTPSLAPPAAESHPHDCDTERVLRLVSRLERRLDRLEDQLVRLGETLDVPRLTSPWIVGHTVEISGNGLGIWVSQRLDERVPVELELDLAPEGVERLRAIGRVACIVPPDGQALPVGRFHLGLAFAAIHPADGEALVRFSFRVQRAQLRDRVAT